VSTPIFDVTGEIYRPAAPYRTVADRRREMLDKVGLIKQRNLATNAPSMAFYAILMAAGVLVMLGLVMVLSASSVTSLHAGDSPWRLFIRQCIWAGFGLICGLVAYRTPYTAWRKFVGPLLLVSYLLMLAPFSPMGISVNGARAWIGIGAFTIQPSEILKLAVLLYCADILQRRQKEIHDIKRTMFPCLAIMGFASFLSFIQKDLGTAIVFAAIMIGVMMMAGIRARNVAGVALMSGLAGAALAMTDERRRMRFTAFLNLEDNKGHYAYQVYQSILSISNGGVTGAGIGQGTGKWGYVPLAHSDFIFAIIAEELGLAGVVVILGGFLALAFFGFQAAISARDHFSALLAGGITFWFVIQAIINIGGVSGLIPVTGLTLPLISYGGSSLLVSMTAIGLLLQVARNMRVS